MSSTLIAAGLVLIVVALIWYTARARRTAGSETVEAVGLPDGLSVHHRPLLTPEEAAFYNVLCLSVGEQYLVYAKVPVWRLLVVEPKDPDDRDTASWFFRKLAHKCVDFVLVHPGTLAVTKVIELEREAPRSSTSSARGRLAEMALAAAGIRLIRLKAEESFTVPALAELLEVDIQE